MDRARPTDIAAWADRELWAPCFQADVVGTAGSGDATIAGFLSALLRDMPPEDAVNAAVAVGACNVEAADTLSGVRPWNETCAARQPAGRGGRRAFRRPVGASMTDTTCGCGPDAP